jgi:hypothetical protein
MCRKKGCAKGGFLESLDRTNFTQHKFARASYAIKSTQPCSAPDTSDEELSPEEVRMMQLDPSAEKVKDNLLDGYMFEKEVNDWFAKLVCISVTLYLALWADNPLSNSTLLSMTL